MIFPIEPFIENGSNDEMVDVSSVEEFIHLHYLIYSI
jgi:hypothetical protein